MDGRAANQEDVRSLSVKYNARGDRYRVFPDGAAHMSSNELGGCPETFRTLLTQLERCGKMGCMLRQHTGSGDSRRTFLGKAERFRA